MANERKWDKSAKLEAADMFYKEVPVRKIAEYFDVTRYRVLSEVSKLAISGEYCPVDADEIIQMYDEDMDLEGIASKLKVPTILISRVLINSGRRPNIEHVNSIDLFSTIDNEMSAYWLGFMFADGYIKSDLTGFGVDLHSKDKDHLALFKEHLGTTANLTYPAQMVRLVVTDHNAAADLIAKGCVPRKSHVIGPPVALPVELNRHFIRGLVDGDGSLGYHSKNQPRIRICGSYDLLEWVSENGPVGGSKPTPMKSIFEFRVNGKSKAMKWIDWLYSDSNISLSRKYNMYRELRDEFGK